MLDSLVGGVVSCFQHRRRWLCLLQHVYAEPRPRSRSESFALSGRVLAELLAAVPLLSQCDIDLRAKAAPLVVATDASNDAEAGACCPVPVAVSAELYRHTLSKGLWNKLLSPCRAYLRERHRLDSSEELPGPEGGYCVSSAVGCRPKRLCPQSRQSAELTLRSASYVEPDLPKSRLGLSPLPSARAYRQAGCCKSRCHRS